MADGQAAEVSYSNLPAELLRCIFAKAGDNYSCLLSLEELIVKMHANRPAGQRLQAGSGGDLPGLARSAGGCPSGGWTWVADVGMLRHGRPSCSGPSRLARLPRPSAWRPLQSSPHWRCTA